MTSHDLRALEIEDLRAKVGALREDLFKVRFQHATAQVSDASTISKARKTLARALTILREHEGAPTAVAATDTGEE